MPTLLLMVGLAARAQSMAAPTLAEAGEPWSLVGGSVRSAAFRRWADAEGFARTWLGERLEEWTGLSSSAVTLRVDHGYVASIAVGPGATDPAGNPVLPYGLGWDDGPVALLWALGAATDGGGELVWSLEGGRCAVVATFHPDTRRLDALRLRCGRADSERGGGATPLVVDDPSRRVSATAPGAWGEPGGSVAVAVTPAAPPPTVVPAAPPVAPAPVASVAPPAPASAPALPSVDAPVRTGAKAQHDVAVVVGLEDSLVVPDVPYARRDADAVQDLLVYTHGVPAAKVQRLSEGSRDHLIAAETRAGAEVGPGGTVWVYFAGHGAANPLTGERMLLGDDGRSDAIAFATRGVDVKTLEALAAAHGGRPVLVLDTCYAGTGRSGQSILGGTRFAVPQFAATTSAGAQWNAASPDQVSAPLDAVRHGAFTYFAIGSLRGWADGALDGVRDGRVTSEEAQLCVARALRGVGTNGQNPVWVGPSDVTLSSGVSEVGPPR